MLTTLQFWKMLRKTRIYAETASNTETQASNTEWFATVIDFQLLAIVSKFFISDVCEGLGWVSDKPFINKCLENFTTFRFCASFFLISIKLWKQTKEKYSCKKYQLSILFLLLLFQHDCYCELFFLLSGFLNTNQNENDGLKLQLSFVVNENLWSNFRFETDRSKHCILTILSTSRALTVQNKG